MIIFVWIIVGAVVNQHISGSNAAVSLFLWNVSWSIALSYMIGRRSQ